MNSSAGLVPCILLLGSTAFSATAGDVTKRLVQVPSATPAAVSKSKGGTSSVLVAPEGGSHMVMLTPVVSPPGLTLGNSFEWCQRYADPGANCLGSLAGGSIVALLGWMPCKDPGCVKSLAWFNLYKVPAGHTAPLRSAAHAIPMPAAGASSQARTGLQSSQVTVPVDPDPLPSSYMLVASGPYRGVPSGGGWGLWAYESAAVISKFNKGDCFVARVNANGPNGPHSSDSPKACVDDKVKWGTETATVRATAAQQRSLTREGCNKDGYKTLISFYDMRVGTQRYTGSCSGSWSFWSLIAYDLKSIPFPVVKAELVQNGGSNCIRRLMMTTQNWQYDTGPVSTNRPYEVLKTRDIAGSDNLHEDVTDWLNSRGATVTGFEFSQGADTSSCLSSVSSMRLNVTRLK